MSPRVRGVNRRLFESPVLLVAWSEGQLQRELNLAGRCRGAGYDPRRGAGGPARKNDRVRKTNVCAVQQVKGFSPELQPGPLGNGSGLKQRKIQGS